MQVFKFGGASVKDAPSVKNVATIVKNHAVENTLVVVSAMGKTTNKLEELVNAWFYGEGNTLQFFEEVKAFHLEIAGKLFANTTHPVYNVLENVFVELLWAIEETPSHSYNHHYDQIVSQGEVLSTRLVSAYLAECGIQNKWVDARDIIQTDNTYRDGKVDYVLSGQRAQQELLPKFAEVGVVLTQGFIGGTSENFTTTLGREGSDYTAALLAYFTNAKQVIIWKDVPGVLNADPRYFKNTKKLDEIGYHDAIEMTYYGATVIHPKTIKPLQNKNIPLYVKSFLHPEEPGTVIKEGDKRSPVTNYIFKDKQILLSIMPKDFSFIVEDNLSQIFSLFAKYTVHVNLMQNSAISFSVCVDSDVHKITPLIKDLQEQYKVLYNEGVQLLTVRNYDSEVISRLSEDKVVLLEQRSRNTFQMVMKGMD